MPVDVYHSEWKGWEEGKEYPKAINYKGKEFLLIGGTDDLEEQ